jgi:hypothetical protein
MNYDTVYVGIVYWVAGGRDILCGYTTKRQVYVVNVWRAGELYEYLQTIVYFVINGFVLLLA